MRTTKADMELVKELIEEKAIEVFSSKGFNYTSMQDIASAAGISRGPLYYHFKSKSELFDRIVDIHVSQSKLKFEKIFNSDDDIFNKILKDLILCNKGTDLLFYREINTNKEKTDSTEKLKAFYDWVYNLKLNSIIEAIKKKEIKKETDPKVLLDLMYIFYNGVSLMYFDERLNSEIEILIHSFVKGLKNTFSTSANSLDSE